jgi:hypothetical protein
VEARLPGSVGPFWAVVEGGRIAIVALTVPLDRAVKYGEMLTVEAGHYEFWTALSKRGAAGLRAEGLPTAPAWSEYEEWPRGRVMYDMMKSRFIVRADVQLHRQHFVEMIAERFGLNTNNLVVLGDDHYRSFRSIDE